MKNLLHLASLQSLVFGDRNAFPFLQNGDQSTVVTPSKVAKYLMSLTAQGYGISNMEVLFDYAEDDFTRFTDEVTALIESNTKQGFILRKSFADSLELKDYTTEEWMAIFAQYSLTYGWSNSYTVYTGKSAETVLAEYVGSLPEGISELQTADKVFSIMNEGGLTSLVKNILESSAVLRAQQLKTIESVPVDMLADVASNSKITIKETLVKVMTLVGSTNTEKPILKTSTDVLRYAVSALAHTPLEGQLSKNELKAVKLRIPTSQRKALLRNLELLGAKRGAKFLTEDMFLYADFWKRLDKYLRFDTAEKTRKRYPNYTESIDLLYEDDRSWTFNGRFSTAKAELDYASAIEIAAERPGFLMRNLMEFLRMTKGTKMPVKVGSSPRSVQPTALEVALSGKSATAKSKNTVLTDASEFFETKFADIVAKNVNAKLAWQLLENLGNKDVYKSARSRVVQGVTIDYSTPIPGADKEMTKIVKGVLKDALKAQLRAKNESKGNIFIDDDTAGYKVSYSGRSSTELVFSGEFLSPGTTLKISDIIASKSDIQDPILRLGIMWRGKPGASRYSVDIDHSLSIEGHRDVYYGAPTLKNGNKIAITSSGDITSSAPSNGSFSTELLDIDIDEVKSMNITEMVNSAIVFGGGSSIGDYECYYFMQVIDRKQRVAAAGRVSMDLAKCDYAIRIDPENTDGTGSYIGFHINIANDEITAMNIPVKQGSGYSNVKTNMSSFRTAVNELPERLSIKKVVEKAFAKKQRTDVISDASIVISRKDAETLELDDNVTLLHPGRDMEEIQKFFF